MKETIPTANEFDNLIERLEKDAAWQQTRLSNCREVGGTLYDYLAKRILIIGTELTITRRARIKYHGKPAAPAKVKATHRSPNDPKASSLSANKLARERHDNQNRNSRKHQKSN